MDFNFNFLCLSYVVFNFFIFTQFVALFLTWTHMKIGLHFWRNYKLSITGMIEVKTDKGLDNFHLIR